MSSNGLRLLFASDRPGGEGGFDIWMSERESVAADWGQATNLGAVVNTAGDERPSQLWEAENLLLFKSGGQVEPGLPGEGGADMFYVNVVPEPSTAMLTTFGFFMAVGLFRDNRCRKSAAV